MIGICVIGHIVLNGNNPKRESNSTTLDEVLIYITVVGQLCISVLHIVASCSKISTDEKTSKEEIAFARLYLSESVLTIFQSILQSTFITKALHRTSKCLGGWKKVFSPCYLAVILAAFNLGMWLLATISIESVGEHSLYNRDMLEKARVIDNDYYGRKQWIWIKVFLLPLVVFFRIHSFFTLCRTFDLHSHIK